MISIPITDDLVRGVDELEMTERGTALHRIPSWVRHQFPDSQLLAAERQPSGARVAFTTTASHIELITHSTRVVHAGANRPRGRIDVVIDGVLHTRDVLTGGEQIKVDLQTGSSSEHTGLDHATVLTSLTSDSKQVEMWLPHNESLEIVSLRADAPILPQAQKSRIWLNHGSSISQGSNALAPTEIWPVVAARSADTVELRNLGFGGSAMADPFMARIIRDAPADLISVNLGINIVNLDSMRLRSFIPAVHGFVDTIRDGHPNTPLLLVSPIFARIHENTPGPTAIDPTSLDTDRLRFIATGTPGDTAQGRLTLEVIRDALRTVVEAREDDTNLHYLDGLDLYGPKDAAALPLTDDLHPSAEAHDLIGRRFADLAFTLEKPFAMN